MSLWPFYRAPSVESGMMDDFSSSMRQMDRFMREMEHSMNDMTRRMNMQLPVDMRSRQAEAWHIENPVVTDNDGNRKLQLRFDVRQFQPEEINVKTKDGKLEVHATHDKKWDNSEVCILVFLNLFQVYYLRFFRIVLVCI